MLGFRSFGLALLSLIASLAANAYDGLVQKQVFELPAYTTVGGQTIKQVKVGYETYGKLNEKGDNAILVCHFFSGNSHAAGKYKDTDVAPGYWDSVIGAGKPFDTDKYFVISSDTLVNLGTGDPNVVTTGPASINPDTGKPYGMSFPIVTIQDFVRVQKALVDKLGVKKLAAVTGASMGSLQTVEWASSYPDMVERIIPVIPGGFEASPYLIEAVQTWMNPILLDPKWNHGDYYGKPDQPIQGLSQSLQLVTLNARHYGWMDRTYARKWAVEGKNPAFDWNNVYAVQESIAKAGAARAKVSDANHFLYLAKANQTFRVSNAATLEEGVKKIKAKALFLPASSDLLLFPDYSKKAVAMLKEQGNAAEYAEIPGDGGHLDGVTDIAKVGDKIKAFLSR
jgi:homoserine O-acetyltransferase/O-succinyltransferase